MSPNERQNSEYFRVLMVKLKVKPIRRRRDMVDSDVILWGLGIGKYSFSILRLLLELFAQRRNRRRRGEAGSGCTLARVRHAH